MGIGIAAAGSGGHIYPAIAVADAFVDAGIDRSSIVFFGGDRMEKTVIPDAGYRLVSVNIHGIRRSLSMDNVRLPAKVRSAQRSIAAEIEEAGVEAMVVFGGYVSGPAALAARKMSIPLVLHEANAVPGLANRMIAGRADSVLVAFEQSTERLRRGEVVGNPLRRSFTDFDRAALRMPAREKYGIAPDAEVLAIIGGSLGAAALNEIGERLGRDPDRRFTLLHLCGQAHAESLADASDGVADWVIVPFEEDMVDVYAAADLVLSRSGAMTIAEIDATATPAVVVPLPAGRGYQARNAGGLEDAGAVEVIEQEQTDRIVDTVNRLMHDAEARGLMMASFRPSVHRTAADTVANRVLELIDERA